MKKITLLGKVRAIFDRKQKWQLVGLGIMIFTGGLLETLGVSAMIPVVQALLAPDELMGYIDRIPVVKNLCDALSITTVKQVTMALLYGMMAIYVIKNLYILLLTYMQNTFITKNRNRMISRVMAEFLNRPYEKYLGADIPTAVSYTHLDVYKRQPYHSSPKSRNRSAGNSSASRGSY